MSPIFHYVAQGTQAWRDLHIGIPTASEFSRIITAVKGDLSKQAAKYAHRLVAETLLGQTLDPPISNLEWLARGKALEPYAAQQYEFSTDTETRLVGFITTHDGRMGCSPDRLIIGQAAALEIKCCSPAEHMGYFADGPGDEFRPQVQGQILIGEFDFVDLYAYHPTLPPATIRTYRDEPYIAKMRAALDEFCDLKDAMLLKARSSGFFPANRNNKDVKAA